MKKWKVKYQENQGVLKFGSENIDYFEPITIGFAGFFLICSIIFAIFFKKYQQKRKKKASK